MLTDEDRLEIRRIARHEAIKAILENSASDAQISLWFMGDSLDPSSCPSHVFETFRYRDFSSSLPVAEPSDQH